MADQVIKTFRGASTLELIIIFLGLRCVIFGFYRDGHPIRVRGKLAGIVGREFLHKASPSRV